MDRNFAYKLRQMVLNIVSEAEKVWVDRRKRLIIIMLNGEISEEKKIMYESLIGEMTNGEFITVFKFKNKCESS